MRQRNIYLPNSSPSSGYFFNFSRDHRPSEYVFNYFSDTLTLTTFHSSRCIHYLHGMHVNTRLTLSVIIPTSQDLSAFILIYFTPIQINPSCKDTPLRNALGSEGISLTLRVTLTPFPRFPYSRTRLVYEFKVNIFSLSFYYLYSVYLHRAILVPLTRVLFSGLSFSSTFLSALMVFRNLLGK